MEIYQLKTFVAVAREGSITHASDRLHLSQPAVSAQIKAMEDSFDLSLFERTSRGMVLTNEGQRLLVKAEQTLAAHRELIEEATHIKGHLTGKLRIGVGSNSCTGAISRLLTSLSKRYPDVDVALQHGSSLDTFNGICDGNLDAGFYNDRREPCEELTTVEVAQFNIYLVASPGLVEKSQPLDWRALAELPWICAPANTCCGRAAEALFKQHQIRPKQIISIDRENPARALIASGVGIGFLHADTAKNAEANGEIELVCEAQKSVPVLFAYPTERIKDPLLNAVSSILQSASHI